MFAATVVLTGVFWKCGTMSAIERQSRGRELRKLWSVQRILPGVRKGLEEEIVQAY